MDFDIGDYLESVSAERYNEIQSNLAEVVKYMCLKYDKRPLDIQKDQVMLDTVWTMAAFEVVK